MEMATRVGEFSPVLPAAQPAPRCANRVTYWTLADPEMVDRLVEVTIAAEVLKSAWPKPRRPPGRARRTG
eukprot:4148562-Pyramimonas_sp.AAC.1